MSILKFFTSNDSVEDWNKLQPLWKNALDEIDPEVFSEMKVRKERVESILEKLDEYGLFEIYSD